MKDPHELILPYFDDVYPHDAYREKMASIRDEIIRRFGNEKKIRVLDLCTGTGRALGLFHEDTQFDLTAVDISDQILSKGRENYPTVTFVREDVRSLSARLFRKNSYHSVLMTGVSIQLFDQSERREIFNRVNDLLTRKGIFVFDVFKEPFECHVPDNEVVIKGVFRKKDCRAIVLYHRIPQVPPKPSKQYVYLIETGYHDEPAMSAGVVDFYNVTVEDICNECADLGFTATLLATEKKKTQFILAEKE